MESLYLVYILIGLATTVSVGGLIGGLIGKMKGRTGPGIVLGALFGPIGWLIIFLHSDVRPTCPYCRGIIAIGAIKCNNCGSDLQKDSSNDKKSNRSILFIALIFLALVIIVFLTQKKTPIDWITDYDTAIEKARQQNKPMLLAFYKPNAPMVTPTFQQTYTNPQVKQFVETNFIPVLINVDEQPDLARKFNIGYYPTHYVKHPDREKLFGPRLGWDPPGLFIEEMTKLLNRMKESM